MRAQSAIGLFALAALLVGCEAVAPLVARSDEPMVYLVLTPDGPSRPETAITALLATTGTPLVVELRTAERFMMRRASDGARFAWSESSQPGMSNGGAGRFFPAGGNYVLSETANSAGLGRRDLAAGETYVLEISTQGRVINGSVTVPDRPNPTFITGGPFRVVSWPRAAGAAAYLLEIDTERLVPPITVDTFFVLREDRDPTTRPAVPAFRITAVDSNWYAYMRDTTVTKAGVSGAYGLFGATISATIPIPPSSTSSASALAPD